MSLGRKDIKKNISSKAHISLVDSDIFLNKFLNFLINNKDKGIKISNFGTFISHTSPQRMGRNPKTKEVYKIKPRTKLKLLVSNKIRYILN